MSNIEVQCTECGSFNTEEAKGVEGVRRCLDCSTYFEDDNYYIEQLEEQYKNDKWWKDVE